ATVEGQRGDLEAALADNQRGQENLVIASSRFSNQSPYVFNRTINHFEQGVMSFDSWQSHLLLSRAFTNQGRLLNAAGRDAKAAQALQEAIASYSYLLDLNKRPPLFRYGMYQTQLDAGLVQIRLGRPARAELILVEAPERLRQLVRDDPFVPEYE